METCDSCSGLGAESEKDIRICGSCGGTGQQRVQQGFFSVATTCSSCKVWKLFYRVRCSCCMWWQH
jgi:molecular chaperone DnaJ